MKLDEKRKLLLTQLSDTLVSLDSALDSLRHSHARCGGMDETSDYTIDELEKFEALTARFARTSDILTQKVFKTLFALLHETPKTFIDAANLAEKIEIIEKADDILNIRELRNQIAHEYITDDLKTVFAEVLQYTPLLEKIIHKTKRYIKNLKMPAKLP